jgi:hypothetical protein
MKSIFSPPLMALALLSGCTTSAHSPDSTGTLGVSANMLTTEKYSVVPGANPIVLGAAAAALINATLPTWSLEDIPIGEDKYRILLRKKTFSSGGDGEAPLLFKYRAEQIVAAHGYNGYEIVEFYEGLDSNGTLGTQRVAQGVIQCRKAERRQ